MKGAGLGAIMKVGGGGDGAVVGAGAKGGTNAGGDGDGGLCD